MIILSPSRRLTGYAAVAFFVVLLAFPQRSLFSQLTVGSSVQSPFNPPYAAITYPAADPTSQSTTVFTPAAGNRFALVGLQLGQLVHVVVQYPPDQALKMVNLVAPDGGVILPPSADTPTIVTPIFPPCADGQCPPATIASRSVSLVISADGTLAFTFVAGNEPGQYGIALRQGGQSNGLTLQFYALDPQNPQQNPGCITATNPDF